MANAVVAYLQKSIKPGGTPRRMKEWVGAMLLFQVFATVLPGKPLQSLSTVDSVILSAVVLFVVVAWGITKEMWQVALCWALFGAAMLMLPVDAFFYGGGKQEMVLISSWSAAMYILERRYYITFAGFVIAMMCTILALSISTVISVVYPTGVAENAIPLIVTGIVLNLMNSYLLITDFRHGKHRLDYFERHFNKISELATSLSNILLADKPAKEVLWDIAQTSIPLLGLEDFVIYMYDEEKGVLTQVAAYGQKSSGDSYQIVAPIEIKPGNGIVGRVYNTKEPVLINDTTTEGEYIVDDEKRFSELAVPIMIGDKVYGVIDSEHSQKEFYKDIHVQLFNVVAAFCSIKIAQEEIRAQRLESEKQKLEIIKMKELEQLKDKFIVNISHDLKTPLSLIMGPANQIYEKSEKEFIKRQATYIKKNTDHLMSMVEQLLQLNRIEQGNEELTIETIELNRLLENIKLQYESFAVESDIKFDVRVVDEVVFDSDEFKLSQCIHNLLQNAFKHTAKGGSVTIEAIKPNHKSVKIVVRDTGVGIHPDDQQKVFDRFYKVDVNNHKGTGIGLSLVKEYVTQLKGSVSLESTPGFGTTFTMTLPIINHERHLHSASRQGILVSEDDKKPLVVVVEDHVDLNAFISESLMEEGFRCLQAHDGKESLDIIERNIPDLIITDLMMPEMSGEELVKHVRSSDRFGHIPVIVLTAKNQVDNRVELYHYGADNYLPKPFKIEELVAIVENTLKQHRKRHEQFYNKFMHSVQAPSDDRAADVSVSVESATAQKCMDYVLEHLDDADLNVNTLGAYVGMGRNKLQKEIKLATGLTPVEFIRSIRLHEAYKLIQSDEKYNVSEIAYMTGFSNLSYFSRSFKAQFGHAPSEYYEG